jgi:hypothetical protein
MFVLSVIVVVLLVGVLLLIPLGFREGDKPGDALPLAVEPCLRPRGATVEVINPGPVPVLVGLSLRRPRLRLRLEGGTYASLRTRRTTPDLLPGQQTVVGVVRPGDTESFIVPAADSLSVRAELVLVLGQANRLRSIHRSVRLPVLEVGRPARRAAEKAVRA